MLADVVDLSYVVEGYLTVLVFVEFVVGGPDPDKAVFTQLSAERPDELVEADRARSVPVELSEKSLGLGISEHDAEIFKAPEQFVQVNLSVSIIVEDAEDTAKSTDGHGAAGLESRFHIVHDLIGGKLISNGDGDVGSWIS